MNGGQRRAAALGVPLLILALSASCSGPQAQLGPPLPRTEAMSVGLAPATDAANVPISAEIAPTVRGGRVEAVSLVDSDGTQLPGSLRDDGSAWVPDRPLKFKHRYTATVRAQGHDGSTQQRTTTFTTMAAPAGERIGTGMYLTDRVTYGMAMPIVVEFDADIPPAARADVERRLIVTTDPPQQGVWAWFGARQVFYRGPAFWLPNTKITVRTALEGLPIGGRYGDLDRRASATIAADRVELMVDNVSKRMMVFKNGRLINTIPVSLGKSSTPSSSGHMVIMDKAAQFRFDTRNDPDPANRYVADVGYAQRLTWGGEFIHAAPWSVDDQGVRNVSHGCVNMSWSNAEWLFSITHIGDPVTVRATEVTLEPGNGWTAWDVPWDKYLTMSALPHPELVAAVVSTTPSPAPTR